MTRRRASSVLALAAAFLLGVTLASPAAATTPGADGLVAFRFDGSLWQVAPGSDPTRIPGTEGGSNLEWSPDGQSLLFVQDGHLRIRNVTSGDVVTVPDVADANSAAWSPDGQKVIVSMSVSGRLPSLWTVDVDGDDLVRVAVAGNCSKTGLLLPSWSPDGKRFAYINHASDTDECRHRKPAVVVREFGSRERLALGRTLGIGMFYVPSIYEADFSADGSELLVRGAGAPVESFGARIDLPSGTITDFDEYGCIRDEDCLRAYQPTPSGGTATIISSLTSGDEPAAYVAIKVAGVLIGEFIDPTVFTDGDEVGFDWYLADQIDVQPLPN